MEPNYVARKSVCTVLSFWWIVGCVLIIPLIILIFRIIAVKQYRVEFYDDKIITYSGLINKSKKQVVFMGVTGTSVSKTLMGQIFNYGDVSVDCVGKWDVDTCGIKNPKGLEDYLQTKIVKISQNNQFIQM